MTYLGLWLSAAGLLATALGALGVKALAEFSRSELEELCNRRHTAERLGAVLRDYRQAAAAAEILQIGGAAVASAGVTLWLGLAAPAELGLAGIVLQVVAAAAALLVVGLWVPATLGRLWAARVVYFGWGFWRGLRWALAPLAFGGRVVDALFHRLAGRPPELTDEESFGEEIRTIVTEGHRDGLLEEDAREMIEGVIRLGDVDVSAIMTPRTDMVSLSVAKSWDEMLEFAATAEHTRVPVYNKTRDDIVGILFVKDLLPELAKPREDRVEPWSKLLREPYFVPETKPVDVLLRELQENRQHMAVVLDEYGGVSGLVSLEDVLEEIVGEIADEYDEELVEGIRDLGDGQFEAHARVHVDEVNDRLGLDLPEEGDFDTIGGLVFGELGHVPLIGESLVLKNVRITVTDATSRRVERVQITRLDAGAPPSSP